MSQIQAFVFVAVVAVCVSAALALARIITPPDDIAHAKRFNEQIKLLANSINTIGLGFAITGFLTPVLRAGSATWVEILWVIVGVVLHVIA